MNSSVCTLRFRLGVKVGSSLSGAPKMHNVLSLNQARHLHLRREHVHGSSHEGMVLSNVRSINFTGID